MKVLTCLTALLAIQAFCAGQSVVIDLRPGPAQPAEPVARPDPTPARTVQLALLLDTSNSMDGLIDQARSHLWNVVRELSRADGRYGRVDLQVALFEYGNDSLPAREGYIRLVQPFTRDLDLLSEKLFSLRTNGGSEFCGAVIDRAVRTLDWSREAGVYRTIFIAGNEPFTQGDVDYREACAAARSAGIRVNTIHCGHADEGIRGKWQDGAELGRGKFLNIDQNHVRIHIDTPYDKPILELNIRLNSTYVPFGAGGGEGRQRQLVQDKNAESAGLAGAALSRATAKAGASYDNRAWDLVDAARADPNVLKETRAEDLPSDLAGMTPEQRTARIAELTAERESIQKQIAELARQREAFLAKARTERQGEPATLDVAMLEAISGQMQP